jgi:release factor glutamine methyltransferase
MDLREIISEATSRLTAGRIENAQAEAEWIVAHVLSKDRPLLYASPPHEITPSEHDCIAKLVHRRASSEPLQYVLGSIEFLGCQIQVTPDVLIPRPETEWIVDTIICETRNSPFAILDIGTGSGAIAIAFARHWPDTLVVGLDISLEALKAADTNRRANRCENVRLVRASLHTPPLYQGLFDLIVSNPPYVKTSDLKSVPPDVRDHEPHLALDGGLNGTDSYASIASHAHRFLTCAGRLVLELPGTDPSPIVSLFERSEYGCHEVQHDLAGKPRLLCVQKSA